MFFEFDSSFIAQTEQEKEAERRTMEILASPNPNLAKLIDQQRKTPEGRAEYKREVLKAKETVGRK